MESRPRRLGHLLTKIVFVTQQADPAHPILGATVAKIAALAGRVDELVVLADGAVPEALPANCRVHTFRAPTRTARGLRFERALASELRPRPRAVIAHMCPIYAVLAAPLARPLGIRLVLWYTHWKATATLRAAERLVTDIVSVERRSFPLPSRKVTETGHGIDVSQFACRPSPPGNGSLRALALGRYSPSKGLGVVLRAVRDAADGVDVHLAVHGPAVSAEERAHRHELERLVTDLGLSQRALLGGPVPRSEVPRLLEDCDVLVNNMRAGAPDKVVYEACASCVPVIASNPVFDELLDDLSPRLRFARDDARDLATCLAALADVPSAARHEIGRTLRRRVEDRHSVERWAERTLEVALR